ncbi:hypothetical protein MYX82_07205 [Acidobacteria bacterium AH-259-D05]|nr:hypothetical protein [Acidobacteria bacterium AH-259-D05]
MRLSKLLLLLCFFSLIVPNTALGAAQKDVPAETMNAVKKEISEYIQSDVSVKGAFLIKDENQGIIRELKFDHVHEGVEKVEDRQYVACVDFKQEGKVLDLDFYVKITPSGELEVSDIIIHKIDGKDVTKAR